MLLDIFLRETKIFFHVFGRDPNFRSTWKGLFLNSIRVKAQPE